MKKELLAFSLLLMSVHCRSEGIQVQGFSEDGHYMVFDQCWGEHSGEASWGTKRFYINVFKNTWAFKPLPVEGCEGDQNWLAIKDDSKAKHLKISGKRGTMVIPENVNRDLSPFHFSWKENNYQVQLEQYDLPEQSCSELVLPTGNYLLKDNNVMKGFKLAVINDDSKHAVILQNDRVIPKSRKCPVSYWVESFSIYNNYGVAFVGVANGVADGKGSIDYLAVTGPLP